MKSASRLSLVLILISITVLTFCATVFSQAQSQRRKFCFKTGCIEVEVADSALKRVEGLMHRKSLGENEGMLFILDEKGRPGFWMKNMNFPLDIIWIKENKEVAEITKNALPCAEDCPDIAPSMEIKYVLEVPAGFAVAHQIKPGERLAF
jgi:uncharacterized protein